MARNYEDWLKAYMEFTADSEAPNDFHFWTGVSTIAGALRRRVWIDMRKFQWTPNFYIILVGPPGVATKSTCVRTGMRLLEQIKDVYFGPPSITWQALTDALATSTLHMKTVNAAGEEEFIPMSCLTIPVSELGTFLKIDDSALVDVLVDLWDGQLTKWGHKTKTQGSTDIENPWLNVIGCTTPAWLKANFPEHLIGGGLTSRMVFVYGDKKRQLIPYPDEVLPDYEYKEMERKLVEDLNDISMMQGQMLLSAEARDWGREWYAQHWTGDRPVHLASERYDTYLSRKQTHIHKLAIVVSAARSSKLIIEKEDLVLANEILLSAEPHQLKVFESIGVVDEARHVAEIAAFVRAHGFLTPDQLYRQVMSIMAEREFNAAVQAAVRGGLLKVEQRGDEKGLVAPPQNKLH